MIQKINSKVKHISKIYNIADVHIRLFKRKEEYIEVFDTLYKEISKDFTDESIIIVAGDIVHSKTEMSPEMVQITSKFFSGLCQIGHTIVIPGNHDANLNNLHRLDALTPIVEYIGIKNLTYLRDTGLYSIGDNIVFSNMGVFDSPEKYIKASDIEFNGTKIALLHSKLKNCVLDSGHVLDNAKISADIFDGFDLAIIGDIHKHQVMQRKNTILNKPWVVYPSSLIQQNYGESLDKHGILVWDVPNREYEFRPIHNNYGYCNVVVDGGEIQTDLSNLPVRPRIHIKTKNTTATQLKDVLIFLRKKYNPEEMTHSKVAIEKNLDDDSVAINLTHIRNVDFQNNLIKEYLNKNFNVDDATLQKVFVINRRLNSRLPVEDVIRNVIWKPKTFRFSNMFSYGEDNFINFENMKGIVGLFSANASGKSSLLEALSFCLFDKGPKSFKALNVMNNRKDTFECELNFEVAGVDYFVKKVAKKDKNDKVKVKIDFWKVDANGVKEDLNAEQRRDTSALIREQIGTYEDFILTALSAQVDRSSSNFIDLGQTDRKDLLLQFMDMKIFDALLDFATEEYKEYSGRLKEFEKRDFEGDLFQIKLKTDVLTAHQSSVLQEKNEKVKEKNAINETIIQLTKTLIDVDNSIRDIDKLENEKKALLNKNTNLLIEIEAVAAKLTDRKSKHSVLKASIKSDVYMDIEKLYQEVLELQKNLSELTREKDTLKLHLKYKVEKIDKLGKLEWDVNCTYCMNNIFVKDAIKTKEEIGNDMQHAKQLVAEITELQANIESKSHIKETYFKYQSETTEMKSIESDAINLNSRKVLLESNQKDCVRMIEDVESKIELYHKSKNDILHNVEVESKIRNARVEIGVVGTNLATLENELVTVNSSLMFLESNKTAIYKDIETFHELEDTYASYKYYIEAIKRDAIPYELISMAIPKIEQEINNVLSQIVDFSVLLTLDGKNINATIAYDENRYWPIELTSGMERFICGLAIRVALLNITNLPRPTFLAIDEGFSTLDANNAPNLPMLLDFFKSQFEFIIVISHMDYMRDFVDILLDLKTVDDFSKITYE